jgi:hypothetical protein
LARVGQEFDEHVAIIDLPKVPEAIEHTVIYPAVRRFVLSLVDAEIDRLIARVKSLQPVA